jgi:hypothetical protein
MSITAAGYAKARTEIIGLFGWNAGALSPEQMLRLDCAVALRLALDDLQGGLIRGERVDMNRMLTASEALAKLLPPAVLASPPPEHRDDPREQMWAVYCAMRERGEIADRAEEPSLRERIAALEAENALLRAGPTPAEPSTPMPAGPNVLRLSRPAPKSAPAASAAPKLNQPVVALSGDETKARMDRVNAQPLPRVDTRPANEPWRNFTRIDWQG